MFTVWFLIIFTFGNGTGVYGVTVIDNIASQKECEAVKERLFPNGGKQAVCNYVVRIK